MLMVNALAGTGKSTTGGWGMGKRVDKGIKVSAEQAEIIKEMRKYMGSKAACAFNTGIAKELPNKMPVGVDCATSNAFGHRAWCKHLGMDNVEPDANKTRKICRELLGTGMEFNERRAIESSVNAIVGLCKNYYFDPSTHEFVNELDDGRVVDGRGGMEWLCDRFDIDSSEGIFHYTKMTFEEGLKANSFIDFDDQNFLPLWYDVKLPRYGHLMVDEVQDLNRVKQLMAFKMGEEITAFGDENQAIYGFSGADSESMERMGRKMDGKFLPLTMTRRCPKSVTALAKQIVPDFRCHPNAPDGEVIKMDSAEFDDAIGKERDAMVLCRMNAPITSLAFKLLAKGRRCFIQGRDIGGGIKNEVIRTKENDLKRALIKVQDRMASRIDSILRSEFPDEAMVEALRDKKKCIQVLAGDADTVGEFFNIVDSLFRNMGSRGDIRLSSVHKAKGLEHPNVYIYQADKLALKSAKGYQSKQEMNIAYVAYTRSMDRLTRVY